MNTFQLQSEHYNIIKKAIEYIDKNYMLQPNLDELSLHVGMSKYHFSRVFKEYAGITPIQFLQATTLEHAKKRLMSTKSILDTTYDVGLTSSSRLHELFVKFSGITPGEYKKMDETILITYGFGYTPFGKALIANTKRGICALEFCDYIEDEAKQRLYSTWENAQFILNNNAAQNLLDNVFKRSREIKLFVKGTNFQINVWKALLQIPYAKIQTYSQIAQMINKPKAVRAVASAIGSNHVAFLIPCHRVIAKSAAMGGYRWGVHRKKILLAYEESKLT
ncbi:bifunctional helix-turn-helix domain-containing protein/methylated-DNA--[protein]-cysteine S-methyltransferase [Sulfurospirillum sp. 1307]|jgi:AraC family transcriptional regulator of adaptative response/methylated-DNA-[protein]-cysteine methyltransferase